MKRWMLSGMIAVGLLAWSAETTAQVRSSRVGPRGPVVVGRPVGGPFGVTPVVTPRGRVVHTRPRAVVNPWWGGYVVHRPVVVTPAGPFGVPVARRPVVVWH